VAAQTHPLVCFCQGFTGYERRLVGGDSFGGPAGDVVARGGRDDRPGPPRRTGHLATATIQRLTAVGPIRLTTPARIARLGRLKHLLHLVDLDLLAGDGVLGDPASLGIASLR
jgi:hypothetical protein